MLELLPLRGGKKINFISSHAHKTGSWSLLGVLFEISSEQPHPFYNYGNPPLGYISFKFN